MKISVNGQSVWGLIDSGCTQTLVGPAIRTAKVNGRKRIMTADGRTISCMGEVSVVLSLAGKTIEVPCVVTQNMVPDVDVIVGTDVLKHFKFCLDWGKFSIAAAAAPSSTALQYPTISKSNFQVRFDGEKWVTKWNWKKKPVLRNCTDVYTMDKVIQQRFESEVERWIDNGWLVKSNSPGKGVIPLMAVLQEKKDKVRPVLDFRELNEFVECSEADADVCDEKLRTWRQKSVNCALLDLRDPTCRYLSMMNAANIR